MNFRLQCNKSSYAILLLDSTPLQHAMYEVAFSLRFFPDGDPTDGKLSGACKVSVHAAISAVLEARPGSWHAEPVLAHSLIRPKGPVTYLGTWSMVY